MTVEPKYKSEINQYLQHINNIVMIFFAMSPSPSVDYVCLWYVCSEITLLVNVTLTSIQNKNTVSFKII